jgi:hypothetical protein
MKECARLWQRKNLQERTFESKADIAQEWQAKDLARYSVAAASWEWARII